MSQQKIQQWKQNEKEAFDNIKNIFVVVFSYSTPLHVQDVTHVNFWAEFNRFEFRIFHPLK